MTEADPTLIAWLESDLARRKISVTRERLVELIEQTARSIKRHLESPPQLRPSAVASELEKLAKHFKAAAAHAAKLGDQGLLHITVASLANPEDEPADMVDHVLYLERMGEWSRKAAFTAKGLSLSSTDHKGGRTPNRNLRSLIADLLLTYHKVLGIRPRHTVNKVSHLAEVGFTGFVKEALRLYQPEGMTFEPVLIDNVVLEMLDVRGPAPYRPPLVPRSRDSKSSR